MQDEQLIPLQGQHGIGLPLIVGEFDLENASGQDFDHSPHLAANQAVLWP